MQSTPFLVVMSLVLILIGLGLWRYMPEIWYGGKTYQRGKQALDGYGEPMSSSLAAALPVGSFLLVVAGTMALLFMVEGTDFAGLGSAAGSARYPVVLVFVLLMVLYFAVFLIGQPKLVIPPHLRSHRGLLPELLLAAWHRIFRASHRRERRQE